MLLTVMVVLFKCSFLVSKAVKTLPLGCSVGLNFLIYWMYLGFPSSFVNYIKDIYFLWHWNLVYQSHFENLFKQSPLHFYLFIFLDGFCLFSYSVSVTLLYQELKIVK